VANVTVRDWMHPGVITCHPDTPIDEVAGILDVKDISALVVVDAVGEAIGVISRADLVNARFVQPYLKHWAGMTAEHLMSKPVISVAPNTQIETAVEMLREKRIHRLVVIEITAGHSRPVGVLSVTDLARHVSESGE